MTASPQQPRIAVFGAGAVGSLIAGYLARGGADITLVDPWFQHVARIRRHGLVITAVDEEFTIHPAALHLDQLPELGTVDIAVLATKSYDTRWMAQLAAHHLHPGGVAISAQNGMNEPTLCAVLGAARTVGAVVPMGAELLGPGHAKRTSGTEWAALVLGELSGPASHRVVTLAEHLAAVDRVEVTDTVQSALWGKLTLNVMSNGLAGLTGLTTNRLWAEDAALDVFAALAHEQALLADRLGVALDPVLHTIDHALLRAADTLGNPAWEQLKEHMRAVAATRTGGRDNRPSLLQDIEKGRRTEIDYLNGWVLQESASVGLQAPVNAAVVDAVHELEVGATTSGPHTVPPLRALVAKNYG